MSAQGPLSRRTALAGLGVGSLGFFASHVSNAAARDAISLSASIESVDHPLTGLWLAHVPLSRDSEETAAAPAFFGADGTAVIAYPCAEAGENGTQIRGLALGTWAAINDDEAHFTAVQVCFDADGAYQGTRTYDGYPVVSDDGASFALRAEIDMLTVRDAGNAIIESRIGGRRAMVGTRMTPGNAGFATFRNSHSQDYEQEGADDSEAGGFPEVAPVDPNDPRLRAPESAPHVPEVAPIHPGDPRLAK